MREWARATLVAAAMTVVGAPAALAAPSAPAGGPTGAVAVSALDAALATADSTLAPTHPTTAPLTPGPAYWLVGADGGVFPFGRAGYAGSLAGRAANALVVGVAATSTGNGYWLVGADGGVFAFGDARWAGVVPAGSRRAPVVAITAGKAGYWLADARGGVFAFGGAPFLGSASGLALRGPVVALVGTPSGRGYWLAGADGGVFAFGDAVLSGGVSNLRLGAPIVAMAATTTGRGYWLAGADGAVFAFGDARYLGGLGDRPHLGPVVAIVANRDGTGYWLATSDGGVFTFGTADYYGGVGGARLMRPIVGMVGGSGTTSPVTPGAPFSAYGYDISWPQCDSALPPPPYGFGVVGVTVGHLFGANPCLLDQWQWARSHGSFAGVYLNTNAFTSDELQSFLSHGATSCLGDVGCALTEWGRQGARQALADAGSVNAPMWWLDVETANEWLPDPAANGVVLQAMVDTLRSAGKRVGVYSTPTQWARIMAGFSPGLPTWVAGAPPDNPVSFCAGKSFGGGPTWMAQTVIAGYDTDVLCPAGSAGYRLAFAPPTPLAAPLFPRSPSPASALFHEASAPAPRLASAPRPIDAVPRPGRSHRQRILVYAAAGFVLGGCGVGVGLARGARRKA
jgi:hypothetical protein